MLTPSNIMRSKKLLFNNSNFPALEKLSKDSKYHEVVDKNGFVELVMIRPIWSGWKVVNENNTRKELIGTWAYRDNRTSNRFSLESYQEWLVEVRNKKLESIGI